MDIINLWHLININLYELFPSIICAIPNLTYISILCKTIIKDHYYYY